MDPLVGEKRDPAPFATGPEHLPNATPFRDRRVAEAFPEVSEDAVEMDVVRRRLELLVEPREIEHRLASHSRPAPAARGYQRLYAQHVLGADQGCDFDFLPSRSGDAPE